MKLVMRGDLSIGRQIFLPDTVVLNSADANSYIINQRATFQGGFDIVSLRHIGAYRNPAGDAWVDGSRGRAEQRRGVEVNQAQKTPIARSLELFANRKMAGEEQLDGRFLPASAVSAGPARHRRRRSKSPTSPMSCSS